MKLLDNTLKISNSILEIVIKLIFIIIFIISIYGIYDIYFTYKEANINLDDIKPTINADSEDNIKYEFNLDEIKEKYNKEIIGWIKIYDTNIDYPILQTTDNIKYLNTNYKNEYATVGSIFLDYRNDSDFNDDYSIIFGHNLKTKKMFGDINNYNSQDYLNKHVKPFLKCPIIIFLKCLI